MPTMFVTLLPETKRLAQVCKEFGDKNWEVKRGPIPCHCFQGNMGLEIAKGNHIRWVRIDQVLNEIARSDDMESDF